MRIFPRLEIGDCTLVSGKSARRPWVANWTPVTDSYAMAVSIRSLDRRQISKFPTSRRRNRLPSLPSCPATGAKRKIRGSFFIKARVPQWKLFPDGCNVTESWITTHLPCSRISFTFENPPRSLRRIAFRRSTLAASTVSVVGETSFFSFFLFLLPPELEQPSHRLNRDIAIFTVGKYGRGTRAATATRSLIFFLSSFSSFLLFFLRSHRG